MLRVAGVPINNITIVGYSLGTGIAAALAEGLLLKGLLSAHDSIGSSNAELLVFIGFVPKALILIAAYTAIADVLTKYKPGGVLPVGKPLGWHPGLKGMSC